MLKLIPAPLHRALYHLADRARSWVWRLFKPRIEGVRVVALDADGRVILLRHSYGADVWSLPGGGLKRGESPEACAVRELAEETGCILKQPLLLETRHERLYGAPHTVHVIAGMVRDTPRSDGREIAQVAMSALDDLPQPLPGSLTEGLPLWVAAYRRAGRA